MSKEQDDIAYQLLDEALSGHCSCERCEIKRLVQRQLIEPVFRCKRCDDVITLKELDFVECPSCGFNFT